uniref:C2H2-type domain-containing protein n=1 Tax=Strongyloides venezuelensis TaxID=75913 RepID=A0A0K0EUG0_STRVS
MDGKKEKFACPHCGEVMDVDMIYLHVRRIFNSALYKCRECDFSTNDTFHRHHHKTTTGHKLEDKNELDPLLEKAISSTATIFMNSLAGKSENTNIVKNVTKPKEVKKIDNPKPPTDSNETPTTVKRSSDFEQKRRFFLNTVISISNMSFEYENGNNSVKAVEVVEISTDAKLPKQKYSVPLPLFGKNKMVACRKCRKEVHESYLSRRKHVFKEHQDDIMEKVKDIKSFKKTDILFNGFIIIRDFFPDYVVCSDFQCVDCGCYYCSVSGVRYHVGVSHQKSIVINCPFENCDFKSGSNCHVKDHIRIHMKGITDSKHDVSIKDLASYVSPQSFAKFNNSCKNESHLTKCISKHYFPISMTYYENFQKDFKDALAEFKRSYLQPHVLNDLISPNQGMNESEIISSHNDTTIEESGNDSDIPEECMVEQNNISGKKRKRDDSNSDGEGSDVIFLKEIPLKSKKNSISEELTSSGSSIAIENPPRCSSNETVNRKNNEVLLESPNVPKSVNRQNIEVSLESSNASKFVNKREETMESSKIEKFKKEIPPLKAVARNFIENNGKLKEEIVSKPSIILDAKKVKDELTALPPVSRAEKPYKDSAYENFSRRGEEIRIKPRQGDFNRERYHNKSHSNYNDGRRHSSMSHGYDNSLRYSKSSRN